VHAARVACTELGWPISARLRERIMLAVATENRCDYCQLAHSVLGRAAGLAPVEIHRLLTGEAGTAATADGAEDAPADPAEAAALAFVRDLARRDFQSRSETLWSALAEHYTPAQRDAILSTARVMNLANRFGNTFDAARARLAGRCEETAASVVDLAVGSGVFLAAAAVVGPLIGLVLLRQPAG
jgi:AhpD family alkylhydroperoxidase